MANDLLTRNIKTAFSTDWMYILNQAGTEEGRASIADILALSDKEINTSSNAGAGAQIAKAKIGVDLPMRTLVSADSSIVFTQNTDEIDAKAVRVGIYRNIHVDAGAMIGQDTNGATSGTFETTTNFVMNDFFDFAAGVDSFAQFSMMLPDEWDREDISFKLFWTNGQITGAGDVLWGVSATAMSDGETLDSSFGTAEYIADTYLGSPPTMHITSPTTAATPANSPAIQDMIYFRVERNGANVLDTYTENARLLGIAIQYKEGLTEPVQWA